MKTIFARISMELTVPNEVAKQIVEECGGSLYRDTVTNQLCNNEFDLPDDLAKRFLEGGVFSKGSSYVPEDSITDVKE